jgi:hypothetical protein
MELPKPLGSLVVCLLDVDDRALTIVLRKSTKTNLFQL